MITVFSPGSTSMISATWPHDSNKFREISSKVTPTALSIALQRQAEHIRIVAHP